MNDRNERIREAFADAPALDRNRVWQRVLEDRVRSMRRRLAARAALFVTAVSVVVGFVALRDADLRSGIMARLGSSPVPAHLDSVETMSTPEASVAIQQETPSSLIPLLGYRTRLHNDIQDIEEKIGSIRSMIEAHPNDPQTGQLNRVLQLANEQLQSSMIALRAIDRQIAGIEGTPIPELPASPADVSIQTAPPVFVNEAIQAERIALLGGVGVSLLLAVIMMGIYVRRSVRATVGSITEIQSQLASQQATLAAGIDAIALEVERLGEGQRYMSKVLASGDPGGREAPAHLQPPPR
jgi:hypothetical protein